MHYLHVCIGNTNVRRRLQERRSSYHYLSPWWNQPSQFFHDLLLSYANDGECPPVTLPSSNLIRRDCPRTSLHVTCQVWVGVRQGYMLPLSLILYTHPSISPLTLTFWVCKSIRINGVWLYFALVSKTLVYIFIWEACMEGKVGPFKHHAALYDALIIFECSIIF